jgi:xylulokinase
MKALLGIDLGTTGIRGTLLSTAGDVLSRCSHGYTGRARWIDPTGREAQAEVSIFLDAIKNIIPEILDAGRISSSAVHGIAISAMAPDAVAVDARAQALMPCILWMDRRAVAEAEEVRRRIGEDRAFRLSGNPVDPYYGLIKTLWIKNNLPNVYRRAAKILNLKDYLVGRLTGRLVTDVSHAGLSGIAFDIRRNCWDNEVLGKLKLDPDKFPDPLPSDEIAGSLTAEAASELGLITGTPVAGGLIDSAAGYLACGCVKSGQSAMTLGTSSCWGVYSKDALWPTGMNVTKAPWDPKGYLINASLAAGGAVIAWLRELFFPAEEIARRNELEENAARVPIGCGGLLTLPHFLGERAPLWDPYARGAFFGLHPGHSREDLYRSVMEGIALSFYRNKLLLRGTGMAVDQRIIVTGGSGRSPLLRRILADVLDSTVDYVGDEAGSDYGAAWLAGKATGVFPSYQALRDRSRIVDSIEPDSSAHQRYVHLYDHIYRDLYPKIKEMYPRLMDQPKPADEPSQEFPGISKQG